MPWLINAAQVDKFRKSQKSLIMLDASLHMPATERDPKKEFSDKHILGAKFFDIDAFTNPQGNSPHELIQDEKIISEKLSQLGIRNDYKIIFYDNSDLHSAARGLWMMKVFGHNPHLLYILDGGLPAWEKYGGKTEVGESNYSPKKYSATFHPEFLRTLAQMKENLQNPKEQVIDVRHPVRYAGGTEPRSEMRSGHIPGSFSFPYMSFFEKNGMYLPVDKIRQLLSSLAINPNAPIIATCGAAITATILDFALDLMGNKQHTVYGGSWAEWGSEKLYPSETSLDERPIETCLEELDPAHRDIL